MNDDDHARGLGYIVVNLQSLEVILRVFLAHRHNQQLGVPKVEDDVVSETFFTSYHSLGQLIDIYNSGLLAEERQFLLETDVVKIRDAIAHGRLLTSAPDYPLTLYKFGKSADGHVPVERIDVISEQWLNEKRQHIFDQIRKVHSCGKSRAYDCFP